MGLRELVEGLTAEQIRELGLRGIPAPRVSNWRSGERRPTLPQAKVLALVTRYDFQMLVDELVELDATPEQRSFFREVAASICAIVSALLLITLPSESQAMARVYREPAAIAHAVSESPTLYIVVHMLG